MKKIILVLCCLFLISCGSKKITPLVCEGLQTPPNTSKLFLLVTNNYSSPERIVAALKNNTAYVLLQNGFKVKLVDSPEDAGKDGLLVQVDLIRAYRGGFSKRIIIDYKIKNGDEIIIEGKDSVKSKGGYERITVALGKRLTRKIRNLITCFERR